MPAQSVGCVRARRCERFKPFGGAVPSRKASGRQCSTVHGALAVDEFVTYSFTDGQEPLEATPKQEQDDTQIDFKRQWYPVAPIVDLPTDRPMAITILGKNLVVWQDGQGEWRVFDDRCPHRQVALSEGRIEKDGTLMCSYHGWRWNGEGKCTSIPQVDKEKEAKICARPAACAKSFPVQQHAGLLWAWLGGTGADDHLEAASSPLACDSGDNEHPSSPWFSREMEMSWDILLENIVDPSHVPFSHHGVQGNRNRVRPLRFTHTESRGRDGFAVHGAWAPGFGSTANDLTRNVLNVRRMPSVYNLESKKLRPGQDDIVAGQAAEPHHQEDDTVHLIVRLAPVTDTRCRIIFRVEARGYDANSKVAKLFTAKPTWLDHLTRNDVLDGDGIFLHKQSQEILQGNVKPQKDYFTPASADVGVMQLVNFKAAHVKNGTNYYPDALDPNASKAVLPREVVLDRYNQHTKHCKACSGALANVQRGIQATMVVMAASLLVYAYTLGQGWPLLSLPAVACAAVATGAAVGRRLLRKLERRFIFTDYLHAEKE